MDRSVLFQDTTDSFTIRCSLHDPHSPDPGDEFRVTGEIYVTFYRVYFGAGKQWYTFSAADISSLRNMIVARTLALRGEYFQMELSCPDPARLNTLRDLLMLCRSHQPVSGSA